MDESKKLLLIFSAEWCLPCRFSQYLWNQMIKEGYPLQIIDGDKNPDLLGKYGVDKYPTFILLENDQVVLTLIGKEDKETLRSLFDESGNVSSSES
jgi:thiol-disulfide isomerase/thioredoxin